MNIHQYIMGNVKGQRQKVGVMVGRKDENGVVRIGWSRANVSKGDQFDRDQGIQIAEDRTYAEDFVPAPHSIGGALYNFSGRCQQYFKNAGGFQKVVIKTTPRHACH